MIARLEKQGWAVFSYVVVAGPLTRRPASFMPLCEGLAAIEVRGLLPGQRSGSGATPSSLIERLRPPRAQ